MTKSILSLITLAAFFLGSCSSPTVPSSETEVPSEETNPAEVGSTPSTEETDNEAYTITTVDPAPKSPRKQMAGSVGDIEVTINYGSPKVKGRIIWGGLENYDEIWRAGANEATTFEVTQPIKVEGADLPAGKYGFFLIPKEEGSWTAIFNSEPEQWGAYEYDAGKDVLRVDVTPEFVEENKEELDYMIEADQVILRWAKAAIPITISAS